MDITTLLAISLGAILTNNFIFSQFLGICPFLGVSKKIDTAVGMGAAVTFVMGLASAVCFGVTKILVAAGLGFMQTVAYILVIASLVQFVEMFLKKNIPTLYTALGVYLPLITTNCAVLGVALLNTQNDYNFIESVVYGITGGLGFLLAIFLFAAIREQLEVSGDSPKAFVPALSASLGVFIPLIVVNCIILGRAEGFASKNGIGASTVDGICQGIGYTLVLIVMCVVREFLGSGKFGGGLLGGGALGSAPGITIIPEEFGIKVLTLPVGGFLTLGVLIAVMQWALAKSAKKKEAK